MTAQKQDIGDPQVVSEFARKVGDESHLDYLYVLTAPTCVVPIQNCELVEGRAVP